MSDTLAVRAERLAVRHPKAEILVPPTNGGRVPQTNGSLYASPVLLGRWQIMQSCTGGQYYIVDHTLPDMLLRDGDTVMRFPQIKVAAAFIKGFTGTTNEDIGELALLLGHSGDLEMARPAVKKSAPAAPPAEDTPKVSKREEAKRMAEAKKAAAEVAAAEAPAKKTAAKKAAKVEAPKAAAAPAKKAAAKKAAAKVVEAPVKKVSAKKAAPLPGLPLLPPAPAKKAAAKKAAAASGTEKTARVTASSMARDAIRAGRTDDAVILDEIRAAFPLQKVANNTVSWHRKELSQG